MGAPRVGSIVVAKSGGTLVHVWPNESSDSRCFTGVDLFSGDCSVMWASSRFEHSSLFKGELLRLYRKALRASRKAQS